MRSSIKDVRKEMGRGVATNADKSGQGERGCFALAALSPRILSFATYLTGCSRPLLTMINLTSIIFCAIFPSA